MGGIEETSNLNSSQLLAMAGGELLKNETLFGGVTGTIMKKNVRSCLRLQEAMMRDDIASQLLVLLAQHRQMSIFGDNMVSHLKLLSNLFDQAHTTLLQFLEFLSTNLHKEYPSFVPSLTELCQEYSIESNIAMCVIRPKLQELILVSRSSCPGAALTLFLPLDILTYFGVTIIVLIIERATTEGCEQT